MINGFAVRMDTLAWRLYVAGFCVHFFLSAHALLHLGYPYEAPLLGPFPFKIHPGTYLMVAALLAALISRGHPVRSGFELARREPLLVLHLGAMVSSLLWLLWRHGTSGAAFMIDTHWMPAIAAMTLLHFDDERRAYLLRLLGAFIVVNALVSLLEYALQARLIPLYLAGQPSGFAESDHFRSSALLGHPLTNSKVAALLLPLALFLPMGALRRWAYVLLVFLSLLAFGGRAALAVALLVYGCWGGIWLLTSLVKGRFSYLQLTGGAVVAMVAIGVLSGVVIVTGLGERIFASLYLDSSASVRLRVLSAYEHLSVDELWFGISAREIDGVALRLGLDPKYEAIENGWIYLSMQLGLLAFGAWTLGFCSLMLWLMRKGPGLACAGVIVFVLTASTSNSFASKSIAQGLLVVYVVGAAAQRRLDRQRAMQMAQALATSGRRRPMPGWGAGTGARRSPAGGSMPLGLQRP
jgi:hypothetical protein